MLIHQSTHLQLIPPSKKIRQRFQIILGVDVDSGVIIPPPLTFVLSMNHSQSMVWVANSEQAANNWTGFLVAISQHEQRLTMWMVWVAKPE